MKATSANNPSATSRSWLHTLLLWSSAWLTVSTLPATSWAQSICDSDLSTIGVAPLNDLGLSLYSGTTVGGLYPGGMNHRPNPHLDAGVAIADDEVLPRDASGAIDLIGGSTGLISIGMSNTTQEFAQGPRSSSTSWPTRPPRFTSAATLNERAHGWQAEADEPARTVGLGRHLAGPSHPPHASR